MTQDELTNLRTSGIIDGIPVIRGTRIPIASLVGHLRAGRPLDEFLSISGGVTQAQLCSVIVAGLELMIEQRSHLVHEERPS